MFTEPADQSVWWYHHFLLTWAEGGIDDYSAERFVDVLRAERSTLVDLIDIEGRCKVISFYLHLYGVEVFPGLAGRGKGGGVVWVFASRRSE